MPKVEMQVKPLRCVFLGYLWRIVEPLNASHRIQFVGAGLESNRARSAEARQAFEARGIPIFNADKIKSNSEFQAILREGIDLIVIGAFGQILPASMIDACNGQILNLHTSYLPNYRGGTPMECQILAGEDSGGITFHWIDEGVDTGPIAAQKKIPIAVDRDSYEMLFEKYHVAAADLMKELLETEISNWPRRPQPVDYPLIPPVKSAQFQIDWAEPAAKIRRNVLAVGGRGWVRNYFTNAGELVIFEADVGPDSGSAPGTIMTAGENPVIATGKGTLVLKKFSASAGLRAGELMEKGPLN